MLNASLVCLVVFAAAVVCGAPSSSTLEVLTQDDHILNIHPHIHELSNFREDIYSRKYLVSDEDLENDSENSSSKDDSVERIHFIPRIKRSLSFIKGVLEAPKGSQTKTNGGVVSVGGVIVGTANQQLDNVKTEVGQTGGVLIEGTVNIGGSLTNEPNRQINNFGQQIFQTGGLLVQTKADTAGSIGGVIGTVDNEVDKLKTQAGQTGGVLVKGKATVTGSLEDLAVKKISSSVFLPFAK